MVKSGGRGGIGVQGDTSSSGIELAERWLTGLVGVPGEAGTDLEVRLGDLGQDLENKFWRNIVVLPFCGG